jgi:AraC family transcriptional regulator of adaptative response/methylated-DNA-[protein]-cysteine methyltransferase
VVNRDRSQDGSFFFAVRTTGVYCRPSCPARRPRTENVTFFMSPDEAERAGYRACLRCRPRDEVPAAERLVAGAKELIDSAPEEPARLADLAAALSVSAGHLQRTFKRVTGLSPRQYAEAQRLQRFKRGSAGRDVTSATYEAGYGSGHVRGRLTSCWA